MKPLPLTVTAIVSAARQRDPALQPSEEHQPVSDAVGLALHGNARSLSEAADSVYYEPERTRLPRISGESSNTTRTDKDEYLPKPFPRVPSAQSMPGDMLFVVGCDRRAGDKWYRVLHDSKVLLKGSCSSAEFEHRAVGSTGSNLFAIGIAQAKQSLPRPTAFYTPDLNTERVVLYNTKIDSAFLC